jgi:hypothetical protein
MDPIVSTFREVSTKLDQGHTAVGVKERLREDVDKIADDTLCSTRQFLDLGGQVKTASCGRLKTGHHERAAETMQFYLTPAATRKRPLPFPC